jgi:hypothetical protein
MGLFYVNWDMKSMLGGYLVNMELGDVRLRMDKGFQTCKVAADTVNKQSRTTDKGRTFKLGLGRRGNDPSP